MSKTASWQDANSRFLSLSLEWVRAKLELAAGEAETKPAKAASRRNPDVILEEIDKLETGMEPRPALALLAKRMGLSRFERDTLLLGAATELDSRMARLCSFAQSDPASCFATFALALSIFEDAAWDVVSPDRPLRFWRLIEVASSPSQPLTGSPLRTDERIVNFIKGLNHLDERLAPLLTPLGSSDEARMSPSQQAAADEVASRWKHATVPPLAELLGAGPPSKHLVAAYAAARFGRVVYRLSPELLPAQSSEIETLGRLWQRESLLLPLALYVDAEEMSGTSETQAHVALRRLLARWNGFLFLGTRESWPQLERPSFAVEVRKPAQEEQRQAWAQALGEGADGHPATLAAQFNLSLSTVYEIAETAMAEQPAGGSDLSQRLWDHCCGHARPAMDRLAHRLEAKAGWDDIVLPPDETDLLRQIAAQVGSRAKVYNEWGFARSMNRGMGISALFAGDSGTGKTMAAEVVALDLRLNLYRIDLAAVVSKYVGETEKNLQRLFDAADDGGAILFFDEADALFGKRSEVKDSHDRYANIEINYLLQRIESYRGLAILATNMKGALDSAFIRRLRFVVNFPFPGVAERRRIWEKVFPADTPLGPIDYGRLARLNLTGGTIHNAALNAAFRAAHAGAKVTMPLVLSSVRGEMLKLDRPINEADFLDATASEAVA